jgi:hypothetical protein
VRIALFLVACGVAPVRYDGDASPPPRWTYATVHGRPLAFHGDVCAVNRPHRHDYPPTPADAFELTAAGWFDKRKVWPYADAHPHHNRTCFRAGWHLHLEAPLASLLWDESAGAWRASPQLAHEAARQVAVEVVPLAR